MKQSIQKRHSSERGTFNRGWLNAKYTFNFNNYYDYRYDGFSDLLVINDDRIGPLKGFDTHPHANMEIFTYIMKGEMAHEDSIDRKKGVIKTGEFQYMAAGTGVRHSERSVSSDETHLLQIWIKPDILNAQPRYESRTKEQISEMKKSPLIVLASGTGRDDSIKFNNKETEILLLQLNKDEIFEFSLKGNKFYYFQVAEGSVFINDDLYEQGDGGRIEETSNFNILSFKGNEKVQVILFELRKIT